ncbi:MAG: hypothetical protein ACR2OD_02670, partial [Gaiellaceae bacterium]
MSTPMAADPDREWDAALADAEIDAASALLWALPDAHSEEGINAVYYASGVLVEESSTDPSLIALSSE